MRSVPAILLALVWGCGCAKQAEPQPATGGTAASAPTHAPAPATASSQPALDEPPLPPRRTAAPDEPEVVEQGPPAATLSAHPRWLSDEAVDVAPAAPATATALGVVLVSRDDRLHLAPLGKLPRGRATKSPIARLTADPDAFALTRGPSVLGQRVYWISQRQLLASELNAQGMLGEPVPLAHDALPRTRVAVPVPAAAKLAPLPPVVAYIARIPGDPPRNVAKLWIQGAPTVTLTPDGASTSSVALAHGEQGLVAWSVEGRTGMTPVHAREIRFNGQTARMLEDRVVWVGGPSQAFTEITPLGTKRGPLRALLPMERDLRSFGLLQLALTPETSEQWSIYPNGIDPAPVASAELCGEQVVARVTPQAASGATPQQLEILSAEPNGSPPWLLAFAQRFFDVSLHAVAGGALLVSVADQRTLAQTLRCRTP